MKRLLLIFLVISLTAFQSFLPAQAQLPQGTAELFGAATGSSLYCLQVMADGSDTPSSTNDWDIVYGGKVIASSGKANGWSTYAITGYGVSGYIDVRVPLAASVGSNYQVRTYAKDGSVSTGVGCSGHFSVTPNEPNIVGVTCSPATILPGGSTTVTVTMSRAWDSGGTIQVLQFSPNGTDFPTTNVTIAPGSASGSALVKVASSIPAGQMTILADGSPMCDSFYTTLMVLSITDLTFTPNPVIGSALSTGKVTLLAPAPPGGLTLGLTSSNTAIATVNANVTVPAGASSATFPISTSLVANSTTVTITVSSSAGEISKAASLTVIPILTGLTITPSTVVGTQSAIGAITLAAPAPTGGLQVTLASSNAAAVVPAGIIVPAGATSVSFNVTTSPVASTVMVTLSATSSGGNATASLKIQPLLASLTLNPTTVVATQTSTGTITLTAPAPAGGNAISLSSNNPAASVPPVVTFAAGQSRATFTVTTTLVASQTSATITAFDGAVTLSAGMVIKPLLASLSLNPASVYSGSGSTATLTLNGSALSSDITITLNSSVSAASVPPSVILSAGTTSVTFPVSTNLALTALTQVIISATYGPQTLTTTLTILPCGPSLLTSLSLQPTTVYSGSASIGTLSLNRPAVTGGQVIALSSSSPFAAVPPFVTIPPGSLSAPFTIQTRGVGTSASVTITAAYPNGPPLTASLTILPMPFWLSIDPDQVVGGNGSTGTIHLTSPALAGGLTINLSSSGAATVPASVNIAAGQTTATFSITTPAVTAITPVMISATSPSYIGAVATAPLLIIPSTSTTRGQVSQGLCSNLPVTGIDAPGTGLVWDIHLGTIFIASNTMPNGWTVTLSGSQFTVCCPASAAAVTGYEVRYAGGPGGGVGLSMGRSGLINRQRLGTGTAGVSSGGSQDGLRQKRAAPMATSPTPINGGPQSAYFDVVTGACSGQNGLSLTAAGQAAGYQLSIFACGFSPGYGFDVAGSAVAADGSVWVTDFLSHLYKFNFDVDGQRASQATVYTTHSGLGLWAWGGSLYMGELSTNNLVELNLDGTVKRVVATLPGQPWGITTNPLNGHLLVNVVKSASTDVDDVNPIDGSIQTVVSNVPGFLDGITISPDGSVVYVAAFPTNILGFSMATGAQVYSSPQLSGADGVTLGSGTLSGMLFVNSDANVFQIEINTGIVTKIASGGSTGDFVGFDPNGSLFISQSDRVVRLLPSPGGRFGGAPSYTIATRDDLANANTTPYSAFTVGAPVLEGSAAQLATFDFFGLGGTVYAGHMQRSGQIAWSSANDRFDLQFGMRSLTTDPVSGNSLASYGPVQMSETIASPFPYFPNWELAAAFLPDVQAELGYVYQVKLVDLASSVCGNYLIADTPQQNWPTAKNVFTLVSGSGDIPHIVAGRCLDITAPGVEAPLYGLWDIVINNSIVASSGRPNGWNVESDHLQAVGISYNGLIVSVPSSAVAAFGCKVRVAGGRSGYFNVVANDTGSAPLLLPLALSAGTLRGGNSTLLTLTLDKPAPLGGATISLASANPTIAPLPASITIPTGSTTALVSIATPSVTAPIQVPLQAEYNGYRQAALTVLDPNGNPPPAPVLTAVGGNGVVHLDWTVAAGADTYNLYRALNHGGPYQLWFAGLTGIHFDDNAVINGVTYYYVVTAANVYGESPASNEASATPTTPVPVQSLLVMPVSVRGGTSATAVVTLVMTAPSGGVLVTLTSSNTSAATLPASVLVPAGSSSTSVTVTTFPVSPTRSVILTALSGGAMAQATLIVTAPKVASVTITPSQVVGGDHASGIVTLDSPAASGGANVLLQSSDTTVATVPGSVMVPAGSTTSPSFDVTTFPVATIQGVSIQATYNGSASAPLSVTSLLASLTLNPTTVVGGNPSTATLNLNEAVSLDTAIAISSDNPNAQAPASITVLAGNASQQFAVTTTAVASAVTANIKATYKGTSVSAPLGITPPGTLLTLTVNPTSVFGGSCAVGTVTLTAAAPAGGVLVSLASTLPSTVPPVVLVPAGKSAVDFLVGTYPVAVDSPATLTATLGAVQRQAILDVQPAVTQVLGTLADASVQSGANASANFGTQPLLLTANLGASNDNSGAAYLKFDLTNVTKLPYSVALKLNVNGASSPSAGISHVKIYGVGNTSWLETGITWNNAPSLDIFNFVGVGTLLTAQDVPLLGGVATFDITDYIKGHLGQLVTLQAIDETNDNLSLNFNSKEAAAGPPALVLVFPGSNFGVLNDIPAPLWAENVIPTDSVNSGGMGPSSADSVNLASGIYENRPGPDLIAENFMGPSASYGRMYRSTRAQAGYASPGLSIGWVDNYDLQVHTTSGGNPGGFGKIASGSKRTQNGAVRPEGDPPGGNPGGGWGTLQLAYPNGAQEVWTPTLDFSGNPTGHLTSGTPGIPYMVSGVASATAGQWQSLTVTFADRTSWTFLPDADNLANYRLSRIANLIGNGISINRDAGHLLTSVKDSGGNALLQFSYSGGFLSTITDNIGRSLMLTFTSVGAGAATNLTQVSQVHQGAAAPATRWQYAYTTTNGIPFLTQVGIADPNNTTGIVSHPIYYDAIGRVSSIIDSNGNVRSYNFRNGLTDVQVQDVMGNSIAKWTQKFGALNMKTGIIDALGKSAGVTYNDPTNSYKVDSATNKNNQTMGFTHDSHGNVTSMTGPVAGGQVTTAFTYDYTVFPLGQLVQAQEGTKTPTKYAYYPSGLLKTLYTPIPGKVSALSWRREDYVYTALGNIQSVTTPGPNSDPTQVITKNYYYTADPYYPNDHDAIQTEMTGRPVAVEVVGTPDQYGVRMTTHTHYRYQTQGVSFGGLVKAEIDSLGNRTDYTFNEAKQPGSILFPATGQTGTGRAHLDYYYAQVGKPAQLLYYYDESNVAVRRITPSYGKEAEMAQQGISGTPIQDALTFDAQYRPTQIKDGNNHKAATVTYDAVGNVQAVAPAIGPAAQASYDAEGNIQNFIDGKGQNTAYTRAPDDSRVTHVAHQDGTSSVDLEYDTYGRPVLVSNGQAILQYAYDDYDQIIGITTTYATQGSCQTSYQFNTDGSRQSLSLQDTAGKTWNYNYIYDGLTRVSRVTFPWVGGFADYKYDSEGRVTIQHSAKADTIYTYNPRGQLSDLLNLSTYPAGPTGPNNPTVNDPYDNNPHRILSHFANITYDVFGHRTYMHSTIPPVPNSGTARGIGNLSSTYTYSYDVGGRLTEEKRILVNTGLPVYDNTFNTDAAGNKTTLRGAAAAYNANNQLTNSGFAYDGNGNSTSYQGVGGITYNADAQVLNIPGMLTANYDGTGQRAWKQNSLGRTYFLYDGDDVVAELNANGQFIGGYGYGEAGLLQRYKVSDTAYYEYTFDPDGSLLQRHRQFDLAADRSILYASTEAIFDIKGQLMGDYDAETGNAYPLSDAVGYQGQWGSYTDTETRLSQTDPSALITIGGGYYDPLTGRYLTRTSNKTNSYEAETGDNYWFSSLAETEKGELSWSGFLHNPPRWAFGEVLTDLHDSSASFGEAVGRYDSGKASAGEVALKGGLAAMSVLNVALPAGKGISALGHLGAGLLAGEGEEIIVEGIAERCGTPGGPCFVAGTLISLADGRLLPIEAVTAGDFVLTRSERTGVTEAKRVSDTTVRQVGSVLTLRLADAVTGRIMETLTTTSSHPFYVRSKGFVEAGALGIGTQIVTRAGPVLVVAGSVQTCRSAGYTVYNFTVEDDHTYFVGSANGGLWVHNICNLPKGAVQPKNWEARGFTRVQSNISDRSVTYFHEPTGSSVTYSGGYPDFTPYMYAGEGGRADVTITLSGIKRGGTDEIRANLKAGFSSTPEGYTWHHHQDVGRMQLMRRDIHEAYNHWGGFAVNRRAAR